MLGWFDESHGVSFSLAHTVEGACSPYRCQVGGHGRWIPAAPILGRVRSFKTPQLFRAAAIRRRLGGRKASWSHSAFTHRFAHGGPSLVDAKVAPVLTKPRAVRWAARWLAGVAPPPSARRPHRARLLLRLPIPSFTNVAAFTNRSRPQGQLMARQCRCVIASASLPQRRRLPCQKQQRRPDRKPGGAPVLVSLGKPRRMGNGSTQCLAGTLGCRSGRFTSPCRFRSG